MKRALLLILLILFLGGGVALWWFLRDTPEKVLRDGMTGLVTAQTVKTTDLEVSWTDVSNRSTTGFGAFGQVDLKDLSYPRGLGVLRLGASNVQGQEQTGDVVVEKDVVALRPRSVKPEWRKLAEQLSQDPTGATFLMMDRDLFLTDKGFSSAIARGGSSGIRKALGFAVPIFTPTSGLLTGAKNGRQTLAVKFKLEPKSFRPFLLSLVAAWTGDNPTPDEIAWVEKATADLAAGSYRLEIDAATRLPVDVSGVFPRLDGQGREAARVVFDLALDGLNQRVSIGIPDKAKDVTDKTVAKQQKIQALPQAKWRTLPAGATSTVGSARSGAFATSTSKYINDKETDLFNKYYEDMLKKKRQF